MKTAILGATGYTGMVLLRLLSSHPRIDTIFPVSSSKSGIPIAAADAGFAGTESKLPSSVYCTIEEAAGEKPDVVFSALPHLASAKLLDPFFGRSVVIDLSADLRIGNSVVFRAAYGEDPPRPDLLRKAVYGLTELYRDRIAASDIIANPGCYPTAVLLPLLPVLRRFRAEGPVIVNAVSGISGAGRKTTENNLFSERTENAGAYSPGTEHRHCAEIQNEIDSVDNPGPVLFTPHLAPLKCGMCVTTALTLATPPDTGEIGDMFRNTFGSSPFIRTGPDRIPQTADVRGSNRCDISWRIFGRTLFLFSAVDNLLKGASGQAVQNMNVRFGFDEAEGLPVTNFL